MAKAARKTVIKIQSDWLCRDLDSWRVRVPCQGGSGRFTFKEYGGSEKALKVARKFQKKALRSLEEDREYMSKHGEKPHRETVYITNKSGIRGVFRIVIPTQGGNPLIIWTARWQGINGKAFTSSYSTAQFPESECKKKAIKKRKEMVAHVLLPTNY
jgi:hypothetical protein